MLRTLSVLLANKTTLIVTSQNLVIDGNSAFNEFLVGLFGLLGRLESDLTSERIRAGLVVARDKGKKLGGRPHKKKRNKVLRLRKQGMTVMQIAKETGRSKQSVYQLIKRMS